jgi:antitoxin component of RelBE/YafQ-DinJ toxin-antitoxin module
MDAMAKKEWLQIRVGTKEKAQARKLADDLRVDMSQLVRASLRFLDENRQVAKALLGNNDRQN